MKNLIEYYSINQIQPEFIPLKNRENFDIDKIALQIIEDGLDFKTEKQFLEDLWNNNQELKILFGFKNIAYFRKEVIMAKERVG